MGINVIRTRYGCMIDRNDRMEFLSNITNSHLNKVFKLFFNFSPYQYFLNNITQSLTDDLLIEEIKKNYLKYVYLLLFIESYKLIVMDKHGIISLIDNSLEEYLQ